MKKYKTQIKILVLSGLVSKAGLEQPGPGASLLRLAKSISKSVYYFS